MLKKDLKELLAQNKPRQLIKELLLFAEQSGDEELQQEVIIQSARFEKLSKEQRMGTSTYEEEGISIAKIHQALLGIINRIPEEQSPRKTVDQSSKEEQKKWSPLKILTVAALVIGIFGSVAEVFNFINIFPDSDSGTDALTVYVHGSKGPQDVVLENTGELFVDLEGDRRYAKIGEKGRTVFSEIPAKFKNTDLPISVKAEGYENASAQMKYKWEGKPIYFEVKRDQELGLIKGIVRNADGSKGIADVSIMINNEFTTTSDSMGRFSYAVEVNQIQEKYDVILTKDGYEMVREFYYPGTIAEYRLKQK